MVLERKSNELGYELRPYADPVKRILKETESRSAIETFRRVDGELPDLERSLVRERWERLIARHAWRLKKKTYG